jgi:TonB family protein
MMPAAALDVLLGTVVRVSVVLAVALVAATSMRGQSASLRHCLLSSAILLAALAPALAPVVPSWRVPGAISIPAVAIASSRSSDASPEPSANVAIVRREGAASSARSLVAALAPLVPLIWFVGLVANASIVVAGLARLAWIVWHARPVTSGRWHDGADRFSRAHELSRQVTILQSDHATLLATCGFWRPKVILPQAAASWSEARIDAVLAHELGHVKRGDWLTQIAIETVRAIHWFNPVVAIACRRARLESEQATDDLVLGLGVDGSSYAAELVNLAAASSGHGRAWLPAPAIVHPSHLERRIVAMLDAGTNRRPASPLVRFVTVGVLCILAAGVAAAQAFGTFSGSVVDPQNGILPNVTMVLTNAQSGAKHEIRTDRAGRFEFVGLPPGDYTIDAQLPGFARLRGAVTIAGATVQRDMMLKVGSLEETVRVSASRSQPNAQAVAPPAPPRPARTGAPPCEALPGGVGGNLRPPRKLVHTAPAYPASLVAAGVDGVVVLDARISESGEIEDLRTVSSPHPDLERAAAAAVRQWAFSETLLNCIPVEVSMRVTVRFALEP